MGRYPLVCGMVLLFALGLAAGCGGKSSSASLVNIALNKPYVTTAPMEGLTSQTLENEGGLLFTNKRSLERKVIRLAGDEGLRRELGENLKWYLENRVSWDVVVPQYIQVYKDARKAKETGIPVDYPPEF